MNFSTIQGVYELFRSVNCVGQNNCFFAAYINISTGPLLGGAVGGMIAGMEAAQKYQCDGYLINQTERGLALIPLNSSSSLNKSMKNMQPNLQGTVFIDQSYIQSVTIKRANLISMVSKNVKIRLTTGFEYDLIINNKEKLLPYQESEFSRFVSMYNR